MRNYVNAVLNSIKTKEPNESKFLESATEVLNSIIPYLEANPILKQEAILERIIEPERAIMFRVPWINDKGEVEVNRGYRVEFNSAIGPYKGGTRFHKSVNIDTFKFLGFEQTFKNALTSLPIGGGKGGADFNPHGRSDREIMRFCQAYMGELFRYIGDKTDIPAGDIGVGTREIGYLFGIYKKLSNRFDGALSGKGLEMGGSFCRVEATGFGAVYFTEKMLNSHNKTLEGKKVIVSGAGNVAYHVMKKLYEYKALPVTASDSTGFIYDEEGVNLQLIYKLKFSGKRESLAKYVESRKNAVFTPIENYTKGRNEVWSVQADIAMPSATENEINDKDAKLLIKNGIQAVVECSNMPTTGAAMKLFQDTDGILFAPAKAVNAGGVVMSVYEMSQNSTFLPESFETLDERLKNEMKSIYLNISKTAADYGQEDNLVVGANIRGFDKVSKAMLDQGIV